MAILPSLRPNADFGGSSRVINQNALSAPLWSSIDDDPHSPDASDFIRNESGFIAHCTLLLTDMPSDFGSMATLEIVVRAQTGVTRVDDQIVLLAQLFESDNVTKLHTDEVSLGTETTFTLGATVTKTIVAFPRTKAAWDGALLRLRWEYNVVLTNDNSFIRVDAVELNGTYNAVGGKPKVWNGVAWVEKPVKARGAAAFVEKPLKVFDGLIWVLA